jgi:hypothetical protein
VDLQVLNLSGTFASESPKNNSETSILFFTQKTLMFSGSLPSHVCNLFIFNILIFLLFIFENIIKL